MGKLYQFFLNLNSTSMKVILYSSLLLVFLLSACKTLSTKEEKRPSGEDDYSAYVARKMAALQGKPAPDFELTLLDGSTQKLAALKGKIVLLNFWFVACKPCEVEVSSLNQLLADYGDRGVEVLAAGLDKPDKASAFAERKKVKFKIASDAGSLAERYEVLSYPTTFLIDRTGIIQKVFVGASDFDATYTYTEIKPHLEKLLAQE